MVERIEQRPHGVEPELDAEERAPVEAVEGRHWRLVHEPQRVGQGLERPPIDDEVDHAVLEEELRRAGSPRATSDGWSAR
jgi:hypothetical protein